MIAWKKLVSTSPALRREAVDFISRSRPPRGLRELATDDPTDFAGIQDSFSGGLVSPPDADLGHPHADFINGEAEFWGNSFYNYEPPSTKHCRPTVALPPEMISEVLDEEIFYDCVPGSLATCCTTLALPALCRSAQKKSLHVKIQIEGANLLAFVDTGATPSFMQAAVVRHLGLWASIQPCN